MDPDESRWRVLYRATVSDEPATLLDEVILNAASRRTAQRRALRRCVVVVALAAIALWPLRELRPVPGITRSAVTNYGLQEGATRYYLVNVAGAAYAGPGSGEQKQ
jgi:hypothetical protein